MREAEGGKRGAGSGKRGAGGGPTSFARVLHEQGIAAPSALQRSIDAALAAGGISEGDANHEDILRAAERLLDQTLAGACESRESALDLLTVDALITRALSIAALDPKSLAEFPELAMKRISSR